MQLKDLRVSFFILLDEPEEDMCSRLVGESRSIAAFPEVEVIDEGLNRLLDCGEGAKI